VSWLGQFPVRVGVWPVSLAIDLCRNPLLILHKGDVDDMIVYPEPDVDDGIVYPEPDPDSGIIYPDLYTDD
jgi:hypothetical protein